MDLRAALPGLMPLAIDWAVEQSRQVQVHGRPLPDDLVGIAKVVGVGRPELVRVASVTRIPLPLDPDLRAAAAQAGLLGPGTIALTLGYAVLIVAGHETPRLLSHELRHVQQYETTGSIAAYLPEYLGQIVEFGYEQAPFERDAREHEIER